jgi:hydrogenase maturation protease
VEVVDFGIRGMDLAFAILDGYDAVVLLDATPRGGAPGTLYMIEVDADQEAEITSPGGHGVDPVQVIGLVRSYGGTLPPMYVVGCEPGRVLDPESGEVVASLSAAVHAALDEAERLAASLCTELAADTVENNNRR